MNKRLGNNYLNVSESGIVTKNDNLLTSSKYFLKFLFK